MNEVIIRRLRMAPFKTKLTPDYKMNWGVEYKKADITAIKPRPRREVKVFDVREFVKEKKKQDNSNPFASMGGGFPGGFNPFVTPNNNPFMSQPTAIPQLFDNNSNSTNNSKIDVDRILKNLDAKIAEIEAEEKRLADEEKMAKQISEEDKTENSQGKSSNNKEILENEIKSTTSTIPANSIDSHEELSFKDIVDSLDQDEDKFENPNSDFEIENTSPENIDELIDKIKGLEAIEENIKPNMDLKEENKYKEVSDDEFFDDFFDESG